MKRLALLASTLVIAAVAGAVLAGGTGHDKNGLDAKAAQPELLHVLDVDRPFQALTLAGEDVQLNYTPDLALAVTPDQIPATAVIPACSDTFDYCIYVPHQEFEGTNLHAAGLRITARQDIWAEMSCMLAQPAGWSDLQPGILQTETVSTSRFGDLSEGAAGSYSQGEMYRLWTGENCYEFETRYVLSRIENYEPGAVTEFGPDDQEALNQRLLAVLHSVSLTNDLPVEWPIARCSDLRAYIQVDAPLKGEAVTSPLVITGQAVGPWFFEANLPLELVTTDGETIATHYAMAEGEWMTMDFVGFEGTIEFQVDQPTEAYLILRRDNPSDLREHDAAVRIVLMLLPE